MAATIQNETTVHSAWNRLLLVDVITARGTRIRRIVEDHGAAAAVLPYDPDRRLAVLVRQLRVPLLHAFGVESLLEAPAGILDSGDPADCARREAMEEAGLALHGLTSLGAVYPMPGVSTERIHLYLAEYRSTDRVAAGGGLAEENEEIEVLQLPLAELAAMAARGGLADLKTLYLLAALQMRRPELFG